MKLYHATTTDKRERIEQDGFAVSHGGDSLDCSWFLPRPDAFYRPDATWFVVVDIPTDVALRYQDQASCDPDTPAHLRLYRVPFAVVNAYRPFTFERIG